MIRAKIEGFKFGRLTVINAVRSDKWGSVIWGCLCDCGKRKEVPTKLLNNRHVSSCGCLQREMTSDRFKTHGEASRNKTAEYESWVNAKRRCLNPRRRTYKYYGGRGIKMCSRWLNSFENFLADMGRKPSQRHTLERLDNNGNYTPTNCKWATWLEQSNNRRSNRFIKIAGERLTISQLAAKSGVKAGTIWWRVKNGKAPVKAIEGWAGK